MGFNHHFEFLYFFFFKEVRKGKKNKQCVHKEIFKTIQDTLKSGSSPQTEMTRLPSDQIKHFPSCPPGSPAPECQLSAPEVGTSGPANTALCQWGRPVPLSWCCPILQWERTGGRVLVFPVTTPDSSTQSGTCSCTPTALLKYTGDTARPPIRLGLKGWNPTSGMGLQEEDNTLRKS